MNFVKNIWKVIAIACIGMLALSACSETRGNGDNQERNSAYSQMQESQSAKTMSYSPTRETINFWVETWDEPGKLSYVYLQNNEGDMLGYYVLEGLPVSYCAQISPNYHIDGGQGRVVVPAPANDGAFYGEGNCDTYYGKDATTGAYLEYTAGMGINVLLFSEPMPRLNHQDIQPLSDTEVGDEEIAEDGE